MPEPSQKNAPPNRSSRGLFFWLILTLGLAYLIYSSPAGGPGTIQEIPYGEFYKLLQTNDKTHVILTATETESILRGEMADGKKYFVHLPENDPQLVATLRTQVERYEVKPPKAIWLHLYSFGPILLFIAFLYFFVYRGSQGGGKLLSFGKSRARQISSEQNQITFKDVAGVDEAKEELQEIIEFLKDPKKFQKLGGKIPKGVLLMGPPGTGKTLLAKAVSGEAGVPFFSISGSDFVEMFVGVGASRVRDLFDQAKRSARSGGKGAIIFIDEIDAVGRQRFAGIGGGHDEREQTLNALLVEMDGFGTQEGIILMAATNRPDVLDPALLRPGRFDRQVVIDRPDINGREEILGVHTRKLILGKNVDLKSIARQTPGFSGADLANLANEAALLAARRNKDAVGMVELEEAIERVMAGPERKSRVISPREKEIVAHHEAGHALVALLTPHADPLHKISIIPRGTAALGYTMQLPLEDRYLMSRQELLARLAVLMGGRASEQLSFGEITTGAHNDLEVATEMARKMVTQFGMSERLGTLTLGRREGHIFLGRDILDEKNYSERTAEVIDEEIRRIIDSAYEKAVRLLSENIDKLKLLAKSLLEKETLDGEEVKRMLGFARNESSQGSGASSETVDPNLPHAN